MRANPFLVSAARAGAAAAVVCGVAFGAAAQETGSVFLTGHDPDFHAHQGANALGAQHINQRAIAFVMDPAFNPYVAGGVGRFLWVSSDLTPPAGNIDGTLGLVASGFVEGVDFDRHDADTLEGALDLLGTAYSAIVVASDHGGMLTQAELDILNARAPSIHAFVNSGGGLYAMAESNAIGQLPGGGFFGFVPNVVAAEPQGQGEVGFTVTAFGMSLGLTDADVNGNVSHNIFTTTGGLEVVDFDAGGDIVSLAGRIVIPAPGSGGVLVFGAAWALRRRRAG